MKMKTSLSLLIFIGLIILFTGAINDPARTDDRISAYDLYVFDLYRNIQGDKLSYRAFEYAFKGYRILNKEKMLNNDTLLTIIDYSKPSNEERLYIIDLKNCRVYARSLVANGRSTGELSPESFSNNPQSHQSCLGFFITSEAYYGKHGYSLKLRGIEKGINDNAEKRAIVFHGADYVSHNYLNEYGRLGRSFGCPALPYEDNQKIIDLIKNRSCVFIYYPASNYLNKSTLLVSDNFSQTASE
jgi:hypothetical protein